MTQNTSNPTTMVPHGNLLQIMIAGDERGALLYSTKWMRPVLSDDQKYAIVVAADSVIRSLSPRYADNRKRIDEAAELGFELRAKPVLLKFMMPLLGLRSWKDADHDDAAPTD